jgi:hypothetical protein
MPSDQDKAISGEAAATAAQLKQLMDEGWVTVSIYLARRMPPTPENPQGMMEAKIINLAPLTPLPLILEGVKMWLDTVIKTIEESAQQAAEEAALGPRRTKSGLHLA